MQYVINLDADDALELKNTSKEHSLRTIRIRPIEEISIFALGGRFQ